MNMNICFNHLTKMALAIVMLLTGLEAANAGEWRLVTYADGRAEGGIRQLSANDDGYDSPGDIFVFDQKLLAEDATTVIGRNAGYCIRTDPGMPDFSGTDHPHLPDDPDNNYGQCSWSLVFTAPSDYRGSIVISGREADKGTSVLPVVGGTGSFRGVTGILHTTPVPQDSGGVLFRQELFLSAPHGKEGRRDF
jgi:hypothetical protein